MTKQSGSGKGSKGQPQQPQKKTTQQQQQKQPQQQKQQKNQQQLQQQQQQQQKQKKKGTSSKASSPAPAAKQQQQQSQKKNVQNSKKGGNKNTQQASSRTSKLPSLFELIVYLLYHVGALVALVHYLNFSQQIFMRDPTFGGQFKFLTQLNHILQTLFFVFSIFNDLRMLILVFFGSKKEVHYSPVQKFVDRMFVILFTLASMVGILFWSIFFYDRELILPAALDATYPRELNLFQHGWTAVIMWLELLIVNHHFHSVMPHILPMITIAGTYGLWTMCLYKQNGKWPYPFQDQLSAQEHILFYVCVIPVAILVIIFGKGLSILRYGNKVHRFSAAKKQKKN